MTATAIELTLVFILLLANGVFAMTEIAIVSSRKGLLQSRADKGDAGAARALRLAESPNRFLSTVQIGITLVGIVAGALGSGSISDRLATWIEPVPFLGAHAKSVSLVIVIGALTYLSLVVGELVPKRLAMKFPESIASRMAAPMAGLSTLAAPAVTLLSWSTGGILKLFGVREEEDAGVSREEIGVLLRQGMVTGSLNRSESRMIERVMGFEKLVSYDLMIPRTRITWIDRNARNQDIWQAISASPQNVFPVYDGRRDNLVGVVSIKDLYSKLSSGAEIAFGEIMHPPLMVPEMQRASVLLETFRTTGQRAAFVLDEFGSIMGMVTLIDLMETIVGDVPSREEQLAMPLHRRADGSWLIDGLFEIEKLPDHLEGFELPSGGGDEYQTLGGWFLKELGRMPVETDRISSGQWLFEVMDMDGPRVDKVLASRKD